MSDNSPTQKLFFFPSLLCRNPFCGFLLVCAGVMSFLLVKSCGFTSHLSRVNRILICLTMNLALPVSLIELLYFFFSQQTSRINYYPKAVNDYPICFTRATACSSTIKPFVMPYKTQSTPNNSSVSRSFFNVFLECSAKCWLKMFHLCCNVLSLVPACLFDAAGS